MTKNEHTKGLIFGFTAFLLWGIFPIYFKAVESVSSQEILAHRILWSVPFMLAIMFIYKKKILIKEVIADKKVLLGLFLSTSLVSVNWYIFTWAVTHEQVLATSLGYFINPIMSILLGVIFLSEKLTKLQWTAVVFVCLGVANQIITYGEFPWIALGLATTFALYGFVRKQLSIDPLNGLLIETGIAMPFALAYVIWTLMQNTAAFLAVSFTIDVLLIAGGIVTALPLILFAAAAKRIPLNTIGFLQFLAPTISFFLAILLFKENLGHEQLMSFLFIWIGLALYLFKPLKRILKRNSSKPA